MAKRRTHRGAGHRPPHRSATRRQASARGHGSGLSAEQQPLIRSLRELLRAKEVWEFPATISSLLAVLDDDRAKLAEFVESLIGTPLAETTAALHVIAAMTDDELQRRRIHREIAERTHPVPELLRGFADVRATRAVLMSNAVGDGENVMLDLVGPGAGPATFVVYVDHRLGTLVKDAFLVFDDLDGVTEQMRELTLRERMPHDFDEVPLADARAHLEEAVAAYLAEDEGDRPEPSDSWPMSRPMLQFVLRSMPEGGRGYELDTVDTFHELEAEQDEIAHGFLASPEGLSLLGPRADDEDGDVVHELAHLLARFETAFLGGGGPEWTPTTIRLALTDVVPVMQSGDPDAYDRLPDVLPLFVEYVHRVRGIAATTTRRALAELESLVPTYLSLRNDPDVLVRRRSYALAMEELERRLDLSWSEQRLLRALGSPEAVEALDTDPLPDEALDVSGVAEDIRDRVVAISRLIDRACAEFFDVEIRTATRRLLSVATTTSPALVRRGTRDENLAAAVLYMVAKANDVWGFWQGGEAAQDVLAFLGVTSHPSQRAEAVQKAIGVDPYHQYGAMDLGRPELLTSRTRDRLIHLRDL